MSTATPCPLIVGTAGHIDHGKSTLIEALTGTDPDRLAEEKRRGITIELGFAKLPLPDGSYLGVVDVPGHERFVRQMIAGATGIDLALLCIAADDGIMPQTREHLAVLELLGVTECVVALTKLDLVDGEWATLVAEEVAAGLEGTPFAGCPIVGVSARTGEGLEELRAVLAQTAARLRSSGKEGPVRLPIDRVFTIKGAGTVITGTLWQGAVAEGDELELLPQHRSTRVRSVQVHGESVQRSLAGNRTALNLAGLSTSDVRPGDFLATPGTLELSDRFDARFTYLPTLSGDKPLESGTRVHVAHGTREVCGRLLLMDGQQAIGAKETAYAQVRLDEDLPLSHGDRFVVRSYSPVRVIGGGTVLNNHPRRRTNLQQADAALLDALAREDELAMAQTAVDSLDVPVSTAQVAQITGLAPARVEELLAGGAAGTQGGAGAYVQLQAGGTRFFARPATVQRLVMTIENLLLKFHAEQPQATGISKGALQQRMPRHLGDACFEALLEQAVQAGKAVEAKGEVSHPKAGAGARKLEEQTAATLLALLEEHGTTPPTLAELFAQAGVDEKRGSKALLLLEGQGSAQRVGKTYCFATPALEQLWQAARAYLQQHGTATAAELKEAMGTSRKYAIPLLEHFDSAKLTVRHGDVRELAGRA